jgi:hypothetical protein
VACACSAAANLEDGCATRTLLILLLRAAT